MFNNPELTTHLLSSSTVKTQSAIIAEWNLNTADNIAKVGNYRYRPTDNTSKYAQLPNTFDSYDTGNYYTNATLADIVIDGGYTDDNIPVSLKSQKDKRKAGV